MLIKWELHELRLFQIMLNRTLSCEFEKWYKFLSQITAKSHKKKCKKRPALQLEGGGTAETHFLNTALQGGSWSAPCTSHFTSRQNLSPTVQTAGWVSEQSMENLAPTGMRSPDHSACSESQH
jgi:hypothetical protein